jgi:site-specific recombinase XerD
MEYKIETRVPLQNSICNLVFVSNFIPPTPRDFMKNFDIHRLDRQIKMGKKRLKDSQISEGDKTIIFDFINYCTIQGVGKHRIKQYIEVLRLMGECLEVSFEKATKENIMDLITKIQNKDYSDLTINLYKIILKVFYKWLKNRENDDVDEWEMPKEVKWIKIKKSRNKKKLPEDLVTEEEIEKMIKVADHPRDKAMVALLYESGFRIEELLTLCIKNIRFDEYGAKIMVRQGKTGMRLIRIVASVPLISTWIENHPFSDNPDSPLWIGIGTRNKNELMCYNNARYLLIKLLKKAGIKKRIHPHLFRHSRATHFKKKKFSDIQMCHYFGWVDGSKMPSHYTHLSGRDIEEDVLRINGIKIKDEEDNNKFISKPCPRCKESVSPGGKFCSRCGAPLEIDIAMMAEEKRKEMDDKMTQLLEYPDVKQAITRRLKELMIKTQSD